MIFRKGKFEKPSENASNSKMQTKNIVIATLHTGTYFLEGVKINRRCYRC